MQRQIQQAQLDEQKRAAAQREIDERLIREFSMPRFPVGATVMKPETMAAGPLPFDPLAMVNAGASPQAALTMQGLQTPKTIKVGKDDTILDARTYKTLFSSPIDEWQDVGQNDRGQLIQQNMRTKQKRAVGQGPLIGSISLNGKGSENRFTNKLQELQAEEYNNAFKASKDAKEANNALARMKSVLKQGEVTGGPLAKQTVWVRNLASQVGIPIDRALDERNAMFTAEFAGRLANKVLMGGRSITDSDARLIAASFPGFENGISSAQLPAFISMLEAQNNERIKYFDELQKSVNPSVRAQMPMTFNNPNTVGAAAAQPAPQITPQPTPVPTMPRGGMSLSIDDIMRQVLEEGQ